MTVLSKWPHSEAKTGWVEIESENAFKPSQEAAISVSVITIPLWAQRFAQLMSNCNQAIEDGKITPNGAKKMLRKTLTLQLILLEKSLTLKTK